MGGSRGRGAVPRERAGGPAPRPYVCVLAVPRGENWSILVASFSSVRALFSHAPPPLNNRALQIAHAKKLIADAAKKQKAAYGNMFSKISVYDDKAAPVMPGTNPNNPKVGPLLWHMLPDDLFSCLVLSRMPPWTGVFRRDHRRQGRRPPRHGALPRHCAQGASEPCSMPPFRCFVHPGQTPL